MFTKILFTKTLSALALITALMVPFYAAQAESGKVFELRTYTTNPGMLDALHQRFANHTIALFKKHRMENIGYWSPTDPELAENTLIYLIAHDSRAAAEQNWKAFVNDPEWQKVYQKSIENGKIVKNIDSVYMSATPYSMMK